MKYFDNHFLFSETYIKEYIQGNQKRDEDLLKNAFIQVRQWNDEYTKGDYKDDPWLDYIDAVLDILGFKKQRNGQERLLYTNTITENEKPVALCLNLDSNTDIGSTSKGEYYAFDAVNAAKKNDVQWVMLTNGYQWRIYNTKNVSPYENYLEVDIESSIKNTQEPNEAFKLFYLFFNSTTYYVEGDDLIIEKIKDKSDKTAERIEDFLRGKAEEILTELCYGLKEDMNKDIYDEVDRRNIYKDAIILLYRMLFFGYAESRKMLPIVENDVEYIDSFYMLCKDAKEILNSGELYKFQDGYEFWERLDNQLRIYVDKTYNGGLFNNIDKPILREYRIKNQYLIKCLAELSYNKDGSGQYIEKIEYKDLSVRNLGSIYEGILEYQLFIAEERMVQRKTKGKVKYIRESETTLKNSDLNNLIEPGGIYLSQDATERKASGSYYTPEEVVEYIVDNTVGKKLKEIKMDLYENTKDYFNQLSYEPTEIGKRRIRTEIDEITKRFIEEKVLNLSIIDSAMGSGHFLVNAVYRVANEIVEIVCENNWSTELDFPVDISYWKRRVVENCIYGIDINELAVALARLSLWLISASNDKALSFIDHHLKVGDSIIGTDKTKVERIKDKDKMSLFDVSYERFMQPILSKYEKMKEIGSKTKEDVERQKEEYYEIEKELELVRRKYDYYLASKYKARVDDEIKYSDIMNARDTSVFENEEISTLIAFAKKNKFFHWELEFPEVFAKGGFDILIGNPPYFNIKSNSLVTDIDTYRDIAGRVTNIANVFMNHMFRYLRKGSSTLGYIIPKSFLHVDSWLKGRQRLLNNVKLLNVNDVGKAFRGVGLEATILVFENENTINHKVSIVLDYELINEISQESFIKNKMITSSMDKPRFDIVNRMKLNGIELGSIARMPRGFTIKASEYSSCANSNFIQVLGGTNVSQYQIKAGNKRKPDKYLSKDNPKISTKKEIFVPGRIIYQNLMSSLPKFVATLEMNGLPTDDTINNLILNTTEFRYEYILAVLNSKVSAFYLKYYIANNSALTVHLDQSYTGKCLIPKASKEQQNEIIELVQNIYQDNCIDEMKKRIDHKTYKLFKFDNKEIDLIEKSIR